MEQASKGGKAIASAASKADLESAQKRGESTIGTGGLDDKDLDFRTCRSFTMPPEFWQRIPYIRDPLYMDGKSLCLPSVAVAESACS